MAKQFHLNISTPDKVIYDGEVASLIAPCALGYWGVLADHAPLVASVVQGKITVKEAGERELIFHSQGKGFLEVLKNNVTMILDQVAS
jgi:F-type H+-transporting ATPase subunit epsilon